MDNLNKKELEALKFIRNAVIHTGNKPTYKKLMELLNYQSPRSVNLIIRSLIEKGYLVTDKTGKMQVNKYPLITEIKTVDIPLLGHISCGAINIAEQNVVDMIPISTMIAKPPSSYFILRTYGDSMNKRGIQNDDLVLIRQQPSARNGDIVVAQVNDECTLKEFYIKDDFIILKPNSDNSKHKPIILTSDFTVLGVLVTVLPQL